MSDMPAYSQLRQAPRLSLRDAAPLASPLTLFVEPKNVCNFKCIYCPESFEDFEERSGGFHQMDVATFDRLAGQVVELGRIKSLNFYLMGEPFVNRALPDFIRIARQRNITDRTTVTTNATLLKEEVSRRVIDAGLDYLRVSIYGGDEESYARRTQGKIALHRVVENVRQFRRLRDDMDGLTRIYVKMIDSGNNEENARFLELFKDIGDEVVIEPVVNWNDPQDRNLAQMDREAMLANENFSRKKEACPFPFYTLVVHADLRVSVCCVDWAKETVVGDLRTQTLADVWHGDALQRFQLMHLERRA